MKLSSLALTLALLPSALFAAGGTSTPTSPTVIPGGAFASTYVISTPGSYVLGGNRSANTAIYVIEIAAPDVTLDLNGFRLSNAPGATAVGGGVYIQTPENVEIRNGTIADAGYYGIRAKPGKSVRVINVRVMGALYAGLYIETAASQVDRCNVADSTNYGIWTNGTGSLVSDCVVNGLGNSTGVTVQNGSRVVRTVARGCATGFYVSTSTAIECSASVCSVGFVLVDSATLRAAEAILNTYGVYTSHLGNVIIGSRITNNNTNFSGAGIYTNGGGNIIVIQ